MIRNVCIHLSNEQPLMCDLYELPSADDAGLVCVNVRSMDGKRPVFIDAIGSTFFFPYHSIRFLEIPEAELAKFRAAGGAMPGAARRVQHAMIGNGDAGALDEPGNGNGHDPDMDHGSLLPVAVGPSEPAQDDDPDLELEIDEDFLQRIRDI